MSGFRWILPERRPATPEAARLGGSGGSGSDGVLRESRPKGILANTAACAVCITNRGKPASDHFCVADNMPGTSSGNYCKASFVHLPGAKVQAATRGDHGCCFS